MSGKPGSHFDPTEAAAELRRLGVVDDSYSVCPPLEGGTSGKVLALGRGAIPEIVVKVDRPAVLWAAVRFLDAYGNSPLVPTLRHVDPAFRFFAYEYAPGADARESTERIDKPRALLTLTRDLLCHYVPADAPGAWWVDGFYPPDGPAPAGTPWQDFVAAYLSHRHEAVRPHLPAGAEALVRTLASLPHRRGSGPLALLHGDCGAHNFVFRAGHLAAVIDPRPVAGEPIWDLAAAFVSWPGDLTPETVLPAADALERAGRWRPQPEDRLRVLLEEVLIALYAWTGVCVRYLPDDVPHYVDAWNGWAGLLRSAGSAGATSFA